jgi:hypothetical protein
MFTQELCTNFNRITFGNYFFIGSSDFLEQACIKRSLFARLYYEGEKGT